MPSTAQEVPGLAGARKPGNQVGSSLKGPCESQKSRSWASALLREVPLLSLCRDGDWWTVLSEVSGREYSIPSNHVAKISHG